MKDIFLHKAQLYEIVHKAKLQATKCQPVGTIYCHSELQGRYKADFLGLLKIGPPIWSLHGRASVFFYSKHALCLALSQSDRFRFCVKSARPRLPK